MKSNHQKRFGEKVKPKNFKKTMVRLWSYFGNEKKLLYFILFVVVIDSALILIAPYLMGKAVDIISIKNFDNKLFMTILIGLLGCYIVEGIVKFIQTFTIAGLSQRIVRNIRMILFEKLQYLPISFFDTHSNGDIMSRLANDVENISSGISDSIVSLMSGILTIIGTFTMMLILSPVLTIFTLISIPLVFLLTKTIAKKTKVLFKKQQVELGKLNGHIEEMISGISVVKAFNYEDRSINTFQEINKDMLDVSIKAQVWSSLLMPMMNVINNISFALISVVGGVLAVENLITVGVIATFLSYSKQFTRPLNELANLFNTLQSAVAGCERVFEILDEKEEIKNMKECKIFEEIKDGLIFEEVSFGYNEDEYVLKKINLNIKLGTSNAIVGPTGSGKTTIVNLITRFYDVNKGKIKIDNIDIRDYNKDSLSDNISIVLQDSYLFSGTIKENIRYGNLEASDEDIIEACKKANAHNFIMKLNNGYDTFIHESGQDLSQGQRQLLTIARSILKNPQILILDEATSSVDTRTELKIQEAMTDIMKGRTSFIIAHRLSTIRDCDNIIVIRDGEVIEMGDHDKLMKEKGYYYKNVKILNRE